MTVPVAVMASAVEPFDGAVREAFLDAMSRVAFSVSVVTTSGPAGREGITATAMASISLDRAGATLLVSLHGAARATQAIVENGVFCVNVLADGQIALADLFAGRRDLLRSSRFEEGNWTELHTGSPSLDGAVASFDCRLAAATPVREHMVLLGDVEATKVSHAAPLIHWRRAYGSLGDSLLQPGRTT